MEDWYKNAKKPDPATERRDSIRFRLIFANGMFWFAIMTAGSYFFPPSLAFFLNTIAFVMAVAGAWLVETLVK